MLHRFPVKGEGFVLGVNPLQDHARRHALVRVVEVPQAAVQRVRVDGVGREVPDPRPHPPGVQSNTQTLLALAQRLLGPLALGDVPVNPAVARQLPLRIQDRDSVGFQNHQAAVLMAVHVFQSAEGFRLAGNGSKDFSHAPGFLRGHQVKRRLPDDLLRLVSEHLPALRADVRVNAVLVHLPDPVVDRLDQEAVSLLALAQRLFGPLALSNVPGEGAVVRAAAEFQVIRADFHRIDPSVPGPVDRFQNDALVRLEPAPALAPHALREGRVDVVDRHLQQFLAGIAQRPTGRLVHVEEPPIFGHPEGGIRRVIDGELGELQRLLRPLALGDVPGDRQDRRFASIFDRRDGQLDGNESAVFAAV